MTAFDRIAKKMLRPWVAVCYLSIVALIFLYIDQPVAWFFNDLGLKAKLPILYWMTKLGTGEFYIAALFFLALFFRYAYRNKTWETRSWFLWLCVLTPYVVCGVLKVLLGRARPELLFEQQLFGFYGFHTTPAYWSFPSGHTSTIMGLVFGLIILFPRYCYAFFLSGILLISTRVLLTNHYLSDVITTGYLTLLEITVLFYWLRKTSWLNASNAYFQTQQGLVS